MEIRHATAADLPSLAKVMDEENIHYEGSDALPADRVLPKLERWFSANNDTRLLVAVDGESVLGFATLVPLFPAGNLNVSMNGGARAPSSTASSMSTTAPSRPPSFRPSSPTRSTCVLPHLWRRLELSRIGLWP